MKLAHFVDPSGCRRIGSVDDGQARALTEWTASDDPLRTFLEEGADTSRFAQAEPFDLRSIRLLAPIVAPRHFFAVGLNYRDHAQEMGIDLPQRPRLFTKFASSICAHRDSIEAPEFSDTLDYEAELAVVIGRTASAVDRAEADRYVAGFTIVNDVSLREYVNPDLLVLAKGRRTFAPMGPALTTIDEVGNAGNLGIETHVNGEVRQRSTTANMIFGWPELIETISRVVTLEPGDIISTGSPAGTGHGSSPPRYLRPGDTVSIRIQGLGVLENAVVGAADQSEEGCRQ